MSAVTEKNTNKRNVHSLLLLHCQSKMTSDLYRGSEIIWKAKKVEMLGQQVSLRQNYKLVVQRTPKIEVQSWW